MSRKITQQAVNAFMNGRSFKGSNTQVRVWDNTTVLLLYGNEIAFKYDTGVIRITNAGWFSNTTKERLNAIPGVSIYQKNFVWYLNGKEWDGNLIDIK